MTLGNRLIAIGMVATLLGSSGCSFLLIDKPPDTYREGYSPQCDTGRGWTYVDLVFAASYLSGAVGAMSAGTDGTEVSMAASFGLIGAAFAASAISGRGRTSRCRELRDEHEGWLYQVRQNQPATGGGNSWDQAPSGWDRNPEPQPQPAPQPEPQPNPTPTDWSAPPDQAVPPDQTAPPEQPAPPDDVAPEEPPEEPAPPATP